MVVVYRAKPSADETAPPELTRHVAIVSYVFLLLLLSTSYKAHHHREISSSSHLWLFLVSRPSSIKRWMGELEVEQKKKRKKQGRKAKSPAAEAQGTTSGGHQAIATSSPPAQETPLPLVANRPAVVTRDRQGSVAFYAALGQGASVLLADTVYKPST